MLISDIRRHIRAILAENMQLADKVYFSTGKLDDDDRKFVLYLTDGKSSQYTKLICDILYYLKEHDWSGGYKSSTQEAARNVLEYNKNILPIKGWDIYKSEKNIGFIISALENRAEIISILEEAPSALRRNLAAELRIPRDAREMADLKRNYVYFGDLISGVYQLNPQRRDEVLKKLISSKNDTIDKLIDWLEDSENLIGNQWSDIDKVYEIIEKYPYDADIVSEDNNWLVVSVTDEKLMKELGCNSQWCFSMPLSKDFYNYQYNGIVYWILDKEDFNEQYVLIGPEDDKLYDRGNVPDDGNPYFRLMKLGVPGVDKLTFDEDQDNSLPKRQIASAREEFRQLTTKNPRVQQLALNLAESRIRSIITKKVSVLLENKKGRIYLSQDGNDGFGYKMGIHLSPEGTKIGSLVVRRKKYLSDKGFPEVLELHLGFEEKYQRQGYFQDVLIELYDNTNIPIYLAIGRVINKDVFKAIDKLDKSKIDIIELTGLGFVVQTKKEFPVEESIESIPKNYQYSVSIDPLGYATLYHGGTSMPESGILEPGRVFFMSPDKNVAQEYAEMRGGEVFTIKVKPEDVYWNEGTGEVEFSKGSSIVDMGGFWKIFS